MLEYIQDKGAYSSEKGRRIFKQLVEAVDYLHSIHIAHRDLKPDNILLQDEEGEVLKLSDFGISRQQESSFCGTIIGTPLYQAPEVQLRRSEFDNKYDGFLADLWSLGIILYVMLVAAPPIGNQDSSDKLLEMAEKRTLLWYDEPVPESAKDLIYRLLQTNPSNRIRAKDIYTHPWIMGQDQMPNEKVQKPGLMKLSTSDTVDSKELEEDLTNMKPTPSLSTSVCLEDNQIAMKALNVCNSDSIVECNRNKSVSSESHGSSSSSSSSSRKRKMDFDEMDEDDDEMSTGIPPPNKKQKSNPVINMNQIEPINPIQYES